MSSFKPSLEVLYREGKLLELIGSTGAGSERSALVDECVAHHNAGTIDILSLIDEERLLEIKGYPFFIVQNFYCNVLPRLTGVSVARMMRAVNVLVELGAGDMMANRPNDALVQWLSKDASRAQEVIKSAQNGDDIALDHLTFALQASQNLAVMRELISDGNPRIRMSALTALSRTPHSCEEDCEATVRSVSDLVDRLDDDTTRAHVLAATLLPFINIQAAPSDEAIRLARRAVENCGAGTVHVAAQILFAASGWSPPCLTDVLLAALRRVESTAKGTLDLIDVGLCKLLNGESSKLAIRFVEDVISRETDELEIKDVSTFTDDWVQSSRESAVGTIALWLASGKRQLCQAANDLAGHGGLQGAPLTIDAGKLGLAAKQQYLMCTKAVGYLFMRPVTASSILVSTLRVADPQLAREIKTLLFDPLLVSFGLTIQQYLEALVETDPAYPHVAEVLDQARKYFAGIEAAKTVKELQPSEYQRQLERIREATVEREIVKKAHKLSVFHEIVHKSVLLHGSGSVTFLEDGGGKRRAVDMKLHSYSATTDWPMLETLDPVGLDVVLRTFRAGRPKS